MQKTTQTLRVGIVGILFATVVGYDLCIHLYIYICIYIYRYTDEHKPYGEPTFQLCQRRVSVFDFSFSFLSPICFLFFDEDLEHALKINFAFLFVFLVYVCVAHSYLAVAVAVSFPAKSTSSSSSSSRLTRSQLLLRSGSIRYSTKYLRRNSN